jgi:hypothetical protein
MDDDSALIATGLSQTKSGCAWSIIRRSALAVDDGLRFRIALYSKRRQT